jgi:predicted  nucleic acid-binding Zn-ribbon protein
MTIVEPALLAMIHGKLRLYYEIEEQLKRAPKQVEFAKQREQQYRAKLEETGRQLQEMRRKAKDKQNELGTRESQVKKMQSQQDGAANNREYAMLGDTIKATIAANEVLGDELLELLEQIDAVVARERLEAEVLAKAEQETAETAAQAADKTQRFTDDLRQVEQELGEQVAKLPADLRAEFARKRPALRDKTVAPIDDGACGSCWQTLTPQTKSALSMKHAITCPGCGALLYMAVT